MPRSRSPSFSAVALRSSWLQARARARLRATGTDPGKLGPDLAAPAPVPRAVAIPQAATIPEPLRCATVRPASHRPPAPPMCWKSPTRPGNHLRRQVPLAPNRSHCSRSMTEPTPPEQNPDHVRTSSRPKTAPVTVSPGQCRCSCCTTSRRRTCCSLKSGDQAASQRPASRIRAALVMLPGIRCRYVRYVSSMDLWPIHSATSVMGIPLPRAFEAK
jgi:hypothetical protein